LNNDFAVKKVQKYIGLGGISFEGSYRFTKQQIVDYYGVDNRTLERYLKKYSVELRENWYEVLTGKRLEEAKNLFGTGINVGTKTTVLWLFDFRSFLNIGMLLEESIRARDLRKLMLNIVLDTIYEKTGWETKYINQREEGYLVAAVRDVSCKAEFKDALSKYVTMGNVKYAIYTNRIYESIFRENATEYKKILKLSEDEEPRHTMYSEVLTLISSYEVGLAHEIKRFYEEKGKKIKPKELDEIFKNFSSHPLWKPHVDIARMKMASRDVHFRNTPHDRLQEYVSPITREDFEKFLWERSKVLEERIQENQDVFIRLKDK
jgi:hypothetical protein